MPSNITRIEDTVFAGCTALENIIIPENVANIGILAFSGCTSLTSIEIPAAVINIGEQAFSGCSNITEVIVAKNNTVYENRDGFNCIVEISTNTLIQGFSNTIIPNSITSIRTYAFSRLENLTSITIPNIVENIGAETFYGCDNLTTIYYKGTAEGFSWGATNATLVTNF